MGRKCHEPTEKSRGEVFAYAVVGVPHHDIAKLVKMDTKTLLKHYDEELKLGKFKANAVIAQSLFNQAKNGNTAAAIFWLKAQAGWREKHEIVGENGGALQLVLKGSDING